MRPDAEGKIPEIERNVVLFPAPVRANQRDKLPLLDRERDTLDRFNLAVAANEIANL